MEPEFLEYVSSENQEQSAEDTSSLVEEDQHAEANKQNMEFVVEKAKRWIIALGLTDWEILFNFQNDIEEVDIFPTIMKVDTSWGMRQAVITVALDQCFDRTKENIEGDVLHELLHVVVNEMRWDVSHAPAKLPGCACDHQHEERVVTTLTKAIWEMQKKYIDLVQFRSKYLHLDESLQALQVATDEEEKTPS